MKKLNINATYTDVEDGMAFLLSILAKQFDVMDDNYLLILTQDGDKFYSGKESIELTNEINKILENSRGEK